MYAALNEPCIKNQTIKNDHQVGMKRKTKPSKLPISVAMSVVFTRPNRSETIPDRKAPIKNAANVDEVMTVEMISLSQNNLFLN